MRQLNGFSVTRPFLSAKGVALETRLQTGTIFTVNLNTVFHLFVSYHHGGTIFDEIVWSMQSKYVGTGHADITKFEWLVNQHRDSFASYIGHPNLVEFFAIAENESKARVKFNFLQPKFPSFTSTVEKIIATALNTEKMLQPCGLPPEKEEED